MSGSACLESQLYVPTPGPGAVDEPFWRSAAERRLAIQRCTGCRSWRWTPSWVCPYCRSLEAKYEEVAPIGEIAAFEHVHHPVHPILRASVPYVVVLVELVDAGRVRMLGNFAGDPSDEIHVGMGVAPVFEPHRREDGTEYCLVQWRSSGTAGREVAMIDSPKGRGCRHT